MKLSEIADLIGAQIAGDPEVEITGVSGIKDAQQGDITFLAGKKNLQDAYSTKAFAIIATEKIKGINASMLVVNNPYLAFARTLDIFYKKPFKSIGISEKAFIGSDVNFGDHISIYPFVFIQNNVSIGNRVTIYPHVFIGDNVSIEDNSIIYPNVTLRENVKIGKNVVIHSGAVVGADGFGYIEEKSIHHKIPQVGGVVIEDDVEIGANVTIDRATLGNTVIGGGTKVDNLVQIAHNVKIGRNCIIIAQVAIGGSVEIGDGVVLAAQIGIRDHVKIGNGVMVGAQSGIGHDIPDKQMFSGSPAIPHKTWLRAQSIYSKLPEYVRRLQKLERAIKKEGCSNDG